MNIQQEIVARKEHLRLVKRQAAEELITNGRTKQFKRLWQQAVAIDDEIEGLESLILPDDPPIIGFTVEAKETLRECRYLRRDSENQKSKQKRKTNKE